MRLINPSLLSLFLFFTSSSFSQNLHIIKDFDNKSGLKQYQETSFNRNIFSINLSQDKNKILKEKFAQLGLPFYKEFNLFFMIYHDFYQAYQDLNKLKKSFTSYKIIKENDFESTLYLTNSRSLRNVKDYQIIIEIKINPF